MGEGSIGRRARGEAKRIEMEGDGINKTTQNKSPREGLKRDPSRAGEKKKPVQSACLSRNEREVKNSI